MDDLLITGIKNHAGGAAYIKSAEGALASLAATGCFNSTFYVSAVDQLKEVKKLSFEVSPLRLAKITVMSRQNGFMKDMPAFLTAILYQRDLDLWKKVFPKVIDNPKMLRTYAQIARSGASGKVINLSSAAHRHMISHWFNVRHSDTIFRGSVGTNPSLVGVLRQARIKPETREKESLLKYLFNGELLPLYVFDGARGFFCRALHERRRPDDNLYHMAFIPLEAPFTIL